MKIASPSVFRCTAAITGLFAALVSAGHAHARCQPDSGALLGQLSIDPAKISRDQFEIVDAGVTGMGVTGYSVWLQSDSCEGSVVINFDADCRVIGAFPRGNCSLDSLRK